MFSVNTHKIHLTVNNKTYLCKTRLKKGNTDVSSFGCKRDKGLGNIWRRLLHIFDKDKYTRNDPSHFFWKGKHVGLIDLQQMDPVSYKI